MLHDADDPQAFQTCGLIRDAESRGECQLMAAVRGSQLREQAPQTHCERVDRGMYRDECFFLSAEYWRRKSKMQISGELCARSGRFAVDCRQHLWQSAVRGVMRRAAPFDELLVDVSGVYCEWQPILGEHADFEWRFWDRAWQGAFVSLKHLDLKHCEVLEGGQLEFCQKAGAKRLMVLLDEDLVHPDVRASFCAGEQLHGRLNDYVRHPVLDAVVERHRDAICEQGLQRPDNVNDLEVYPKAGTESGVECGR